MQDGRSARNSGRKTCYYDVVLLFRGAGGLSLDRLRNAWSRNAWS